MTRIPSGGDDSGRRQVGLGPVTETAHHQTRLARLGETELGDQTPKQRHRIVHVTGSHEHRHDAPQQVHLPADPHVVAGAEQRRRGLLSSTGTDIDNLTNIVTPAFSGQTEDRSTAQLQSGGFDTGAAFLTGAGTAYDGILTAALADGVQDITIDVEDEAGNTATSLALQIEIDTILAVPSTPDLQATSDSFGILLSSTGTNSDDLTNITLPLFDGTTEDRSTVQLQTDNVDTGAFFLTGATTSYNNIITAALADGVQNITVEVEDEAGNTAESLPLTIEIDTILAVPSTPDLQATSDSFGILLSSTGTNSDDLTNITLPLFDGTTEDRSTVHTVVDWD